MNRKARGWALLIILAAFIVLMSWQSGVLYAGKMIGQCFVIVIGMELILFLLTRAVAWIMGWRDEE